MVSDVSPGVQWLDPWIQEQLQEAGEVCGGVCGVGWWGRVLRNAGLEVGLLGISCLLWFSSCRGIR